uniref:Major facilitator superfamily domain containing 2B n=1 Tax=Zosterops lateralis melanops TaxID=1220523 RepID=A0A8D2PMW8_ZOSLA
MLTANFKEGLKAKRVQVNKKLSMCSKLCYAIGGAPNQVAISAASFFLQIYLLDIAHITPFHASLVLFIGKASGAVTDPIAGFFISKSRWTKIGRLMPWVLACTPFTMISYFFMWYLPPFVSGRVAWYVTFHCLFQALTTLFQVPYSALTMFLSTDQKDRDSATAYRMTMEVLGTLIGAALQGQIVASAHVSPHCTVNPSVNTTDSWHDTATIPDPSNPLSHQVSVYGNTLKLPAEEAGDVSLIPCHIQLDECEQDFLGISDSGAEAIPFCKGLALTMKHGPYVKLTASFLLISTAVQLEQGNFVLFCTQAAGLRNHFQYLVVTILVSCTSLPNVTWFLLGFGTKLQKIRRLLCLIMLVTIPNLILAYFVAFISGLSIAASLLLPWSMLPDVVDNFRLQNPHGKGHETIFYSSYVFFTKMSAGIGLGISAAGLEFAGYKPGICRQSDNVILTLKLLIGAVPAILILLGLFILLFYPITEESRKETKLALEELRKILSSSNSSSSVNS